MKLNVLKTFLILFFVVCAGCDQGSSKLKKIVCDDGLTISIRFDGDDRVSSLEFEKNGQKIDFGAGSAVPLFEEVISPDGKWLLLPETAFGDFYFGLQTDAMRSLANANFFWRIQEASEHAVYYRFVRWVAPNSVIVSFAFNNEEEEWVINLETKTATKLAVGGRQIFTPKLIAPTVK